MRLKFWRKDPHGIKTATLEYIPEDTFRLYPKLMVTYNNGILYEADLEAIYQRGQDIGKQIEQERILFELQEDAVLSTTVSVDVLERISEIIESKKEDHA